jgi:hypothetical protein
MTEEDFDQICIIKWFEKTFPDLKQDMHHFANQRKCSWYQGKLLKSMGVKAGVADLFLAVPKNGKSGLWLELKTKKGRLTQHQIDFLERKSNLGYVAAAVWGQEDAKHYILNYLS